MARRGFKSGSRWFFMQTIARARPAATRATISLADAFVNVARPSRRNLTRRRNGRLCGGLFRTRLYPPHKTWSVESFDLYYRPLTSRPDRPSRQFSRRVRIRSIPPPVMAPILREHASALQSKREREGRVKNSREDFPTIRGFGSFKDVTPG